MAKIEVLLPAMGEGIIEATITKWLKQVGETIEEDDSLVEVATDKVDSEVPAPVSGVIREQFFNEGDTPKIGDVLAIITTEGEELNTENKKDSDNRNSKRPIEPISIATPLQIDISKTQVEENDSPNSIGSRTPNGRFLSPLVRNIANKENISLTELDQITGSGKENRLTKNDLLSYLASRGKSNLGVLVDKKPDRPVASSEQLMKSESLPAKHNKQYGDDVEIIEMGRMRKLIADHMLKSVQTSPHVTSFVEIDITDLVEWRNNNKDIFLKREKEKLTFTPLFIEATAKALRDFPMVNVSVDGNNIIRKKNINIGMAAALPDGNLIVPVIKHADRINLVGLAKTVNDLANRARKGKLVPDEIQGGTFTITNFGSFDNITGTPIINQPEVAILGIGSIKKKPAVVETPQGDFIAIRQIMILSLSYDHRVVDGALGGMFLRRIGDYLEKWNKDRTV